MPVFPGRESGSDNYYLEGDPQIEKMMEDRYQDAININQAFWGEADIDVRFKAGDQGLYSDYYGNMPVNRRKQFYFNRIRRVTNMITGYQRRNRKSTVAVPIEHNDDQASSQWTKLLFNTMHHADADEMLSEGFEHGAITTGMSMLYVWNDYSRDPESGDLQIDHRPYSSFLIDPYFKKKDLSDCNYLWDREWVSKEEAKSRLPVGLSQFVDSLRPGSSQDGKFQFMAENYDYAQSNLLTYDQYWYRCSREATFIIDTQTGLTREWEGEEDALNYYMRLFPQLATIKKNVPTTKLVIRLENKVVYDGPNPLHIDRYPFVPILGYYDPNIAYLPYRVQGVVRGLRDSQFLYNRRKVIELDILESQVTSGFKYKPTSLVNPRDIYMEGQGKGIALKQNADMMDVQEIQPPQIPASMIQLSDILGREIQEISGVNEELLGSADDDKAGILSMLRQGAGLTTLQSLFDQLDQSQKLLGEIFVEAIRKNYTIGKVSRILGEQPVEDFKNKVWLNHDIRIEEGVNTTTQRQMAFQQALHLREIGLPVPAEYLVQMASLQDKDKLVAAITQQEQQQAQQAQMQLQQQMALLQAQVQDLQAKATANSGLGIERISRVQENELLAEERRAQAIENISDARLNRARTLKELQEIDINQIRGLLELAELMQGSASEQAELAGTASPTQSSMVQF